MNNNEKYHIEPGNVDKIRTWLADRGGIAMWKSINLSNPGASWSTPANTEGKPTTKPNWQCGNEPSRVITSTEDVVVDILREVDRFHVVTRMAGNGMSINLTNGSSRRVNSRLEKAKAKSPTGEAWYEFDYSTQECVISVADKVVPLNEYKP